LDAGVSGIKQQIQLMRAAQQAKEQFTIQQIKINIEQQTAQSMLDGSKAALTQALRANDYEGVADSIVAIIDAVARWYRAGR
jgi:hypothetical protein